MAQHYFPLHIVDGNKPIYGTSPGSDNLSATAGGYGATGGLANLSSGDGSTRDKVYRVVTGGARQYIFSNITGTTVDAIARIRSSNNTNSTSDVALMVRGSTAIANSNVINAFAVRVGSHTANYRDLQFVKWTGTGNQTGTVTTHANHFPALTNDSDVLTTYRYLRIKADGSTITVYGWWEGDDETQQSISYDTTDTDYSSGLIGVAFEPNSLVDVDFLAIGTGTDEASIEPDQRELNAIVYQPQQGGNSQIPALNYPVRAYYLVAGAPVGYVQSSATDGTGSIQQLKFGERLCILNAVDLDNNPAKWRRAISQPVTPVLSV